MPHTGPIRGFNKRPNICLPHIYIYIPPKILVGNAALMPNTAITQCKPIESQQINMQASLSRLCVCVCGWECGSHTHTHTSTHRGSCSAHSTSMAYNGLGRAYRIGKNKFDNKWFPIETTTNTCYNIFIWLA